jgi:hypothetical protein
MMYPQNCPTIGLYLKILFDYSRFIVKVNLRGVDVVLELTGVGVLLYSVAIVVVSLDH